MGFASEAFMFEGGSLTMGMWVKHSGGEGTLVVKEESGEEGRRAFGLELVVDEILFSYTGTDGRVVARYTANVADGAWHHVLMTMEGTNMTLFIDGTAFDERNALTNGEGDILNEVVSMETVEGDIRVGGDGLEGEIVGVYLRNGAVDEEVVRCLMGCGEYLRDCSGDA